MPDRARSSFQAVRVLQVIDPLKSYVQQGAEPKTLARSSGVGLVIGVVPIIGAPGNLELDPKTQNRNTASHL